MAWSTDFRCVFMAPAASLELRRSNASTMALCSSMIWSVWARNAVGQMADAIPDRLHALHGRPHAFESGRARDDLVKGLIVEEEAPAVAASGVLCLAFEVLARLDGVGGTPVARRLLGQRNLQCRARELRFADLFQLDGRDIGAALREDLDEPVLGQSRDRDPHRRAGHAEHAAQPVLADGLVGGDAAGDDLVAQDAVDLFGGGQAPIDGKGTLFGACRERCGSTVDQKSRSSFSLPDGARAFPAACQAKLVY